MTADNKPEPEESDVPAPHVLPPLYRNARNPFEAFFHRQIVLIAGDARVEVPLGLHANTFSSKEDMIARADALVGGPVGFGPHKDEKVVGYSYREHGNGPATGRRFAIVPDADGLLVRSIRHDAANETGNPVLPYVGHVDFLHRNSGKVFHEVPSYSHLHATFATLVESPGDERRYAIPRFCVELVDP